jgi:hypothetical protein
MWFLNDFPYPCPFLLYPGLKILTAFIIERLLPKVGEARRGVYKLPHVIGVASYPYAICKINLTRLLKKNVPLHFSGGCAFNPHPDFPYVFRDQANRNACFLLGAAKTG